MNKNLLSMLMLCVVALVARAQSEFKDFDALRAGVTAQLRTYMKENPGHRIDSVCHNVLNDITFAPVADKKVLSKPRKKKLTPAQLYQLCKNSSLAFGKMEFAPAYGTDTAYVNASAVAITEDGLCLTNYHVVSDVVLAGAMHYDDKNDRMRFVMDCDGNAFPLQRVLMIDPVNDFAIIKVDTGNRKLVPAPLGNDPEIGDKVYCLANPSSYLFHFTDGIVSNKKQSTDKTNGQTLYDTEINAEYGVGASGGPIFDECGNIVALVSSTYSLYANPQQKSNFQMAFKMTVPVFLIKRCFND